MKTIKRMDEFDPTLWHYERLKDDAAEKKVNVRKEGWSYCSKQEWKKNVRDFNKN
jgi:hypothetical protein